MKAYHGPYLDVADEPRMMKDGPRSTVFGVLGRTKLDAPTRTLGGLIQRPVSHKIPKGEIDKHPKAIHTERGITGPAGKTHIPGKHHGMVPYPGVFMSKVGGEL